jgi:hypothetical protein
LLFERAGGHYWAIESTNWSDEFNKKGIEIVIKAQACLGLVGNSFSVFKKKLLCDSALTALPEKTMTQP